MPKQQPTTPVPSSTIPSVATMNERFRERMVQYSRMMAAREGTSRENTEGTEEPGPSAPKRKESTGTSDHDTEEDEAARPQEQSGKIFLRINFGCNPILAVNTARTRQPNPPKEEAQESSTNEPNRRRETTPHPQFHKRRRLTQDHQRKSQTARSLRPRPAPRSTATTTTQPKPRSRHPPHPFLPLENEPKDPWHPIPLPSPLLPRDTEGPKAAWARLFPHLAPFGEYGGKPTGWMAKMTWKDGEWRARGPEEPYVERFLGMRVRNRGAMSCEVSVRYWRG